MSGPVGPVPGTKGMSYTEKAMFEEIVADFPEGLAYGMMSMRIVDAHVESTWAVVTLLDDNGDPAVATKVRYRSRDFAP